ncbi:hypothetical protein [Demequina silvatica]|uniref:hypothetical protein n=1 Tax=Demequina silvatica TaxID=1638988 RepID=UPI000781DD16|nr:hypothetical protein [Demequina silvatica]
MNSAIIPGRRHYRVAVRPLAGPDQVAALAADVLVQPSKHYASTFTNVLDPKRRPMRRIGAIAYRSDREPSPYVVYQYGGTTSADLATLQALAVRLSAGEAVDPETWFALKYPDGTAPASAPAIWVARPLDDYDDHELSTVAAVPDTIPAFVFDSVGA